MAVLHSTKPAPPAPPIPTAHPVGVGTGTGVGTSVEATHQRAARVRYLGPNWYAAVMGTAIVGNAGAGLPGCPGWLRGVCTGVWVLAAAALAALLVARAAHWIWHR